MPRPKPSARALAPPAVGKPRAKPPPEPTVTAADKVRHEWAQFESWVAVQRKEAAVTQESEVQIAKQQVEVKKRGLPRGLHSTLVKEFEQTKRKITRASERQLADRFLTEWEERLEKAGLNLEDWDPMTSAEMEAVRSVLEGPTDEDDEPIVQEALPHHSPVPAAVVPPAKPAVAIPDWSAEADRLRGLSPLPDVPDWNRPYTPHPAQQHHAPSHPPTPLREVQHAAARYTGPTLLEEHSTESLEDAEFREFKMSIREQMIREFHEEAIELEIALVRHEHEAKLESSAIKSLLACHEVDMEELRQQKEDKRKAIVDAERTKRKAELRRRALQSKDGLYQPIARKASEKPPFQKSNSSGWSAPPITQRPSSKMAMEERPTPAAQKPAGLWGSLWGGGGEPAKEPQLTPPLAKPSSPPPEDMEMPGSLSLVEPPSAFGKGAMARGKKMKAGKKGGPPPKAEEAPPPPPPPPVQRMLGKDKAWGAAKSMTPPKPTVEDASDEDDDSKPWARSEPKNEVDELAELFFKQASNAAASPFGVEEEPVFVQTNNKQHGKGDVDSAKPTMQVPKSRWNGPSLDTPPSAASEVAPEYWGRSRSASSGGESTSSASEHHTVWKPSVVSLDSDEDDEDDDGDDGGFLSSLAGGLVEHDEYRPGAATWGGASAGRSMAGGGNPYAKNVPPQSKYDPRWGGPPTKMDMRLGQGRAPSHGGPPAQDDWESQMMSKYLGGFAQGSGRY